MEREGEGERGEGVGLRGRERDTHTQRDRERGRGREGEREKGRKGVGKEWLKIGREGERERLGGIGGEAVSLFQPPMLDSPERDKIRYKREHHKKHINSG